MLTSAEIARGSQGAIKFLLRDGTAPLHFDSTFESCLRSFQVMVMVTMPERRSRSISRILVLNSL